MDLLYLIVLFISLFIDGLDTVIMKSVNLKTIIDSSNILFTSNEVSLLACAQRCKFRHKDAAIRFQGHKCVCFTNYDMEETEDNHGTVSGIFLEKKMEKMKMTKMHGAWGSWFPISPCSETCGYGNQKWTRECNSPAPAHGGDLCSYDDPTKGSAMIETVMNNCFIVICPVNGSWSDWTHWGAWAQSCNDTTRTRTRTCDNPKPVGAGLECKGNSVEMEKGSLVICPVHGNWGDWSAFSPCSKTCGDGKKSRYHICDSPNPRHNGDNCRHQDGNGRSLNETWYWDCPGIVCPVNGSWSRWQSWYNTKTCGDTTAYRYRYCNNPRQAGTGLPCKGSNREQKTVSLDPCPTSITYV